MKVRISYTVETDDAGAALRALLADPFVQAPVAHVLNDGGGVVEVVSLDREHVARIEGSVWRVNLDCDCAPCAAARGVAEQICPRSHDD